MGGIEVPIELRTAEAYLIATHGSWRELSEREVDIIIEYAEIIVEEIQDGWPVDTSTSRDAFTFTVDRDGIGFTITNDADYAEWVHLAGEDPDPPLFETLIPDAFHRHADDLTAALRQAIDETEEDLVAAAKARAAKTRTPRGRADPRRKPPPETV